jgi:fused signal recognition particle receptor
VKALGWSTRRPAPNCHPAGGHPVDTRGARNYNVIIVIGSLKEKLSRTRQFLKQKIVELVKSGRPRDEMLEELGEILILADVGVPTTEKIIRAIEQRTKKTDSFEAVEGALKSELVGILSRYRTGLALDSQPGVLMMVVAHMFKRQGKNVLLVAADTFRAAAQEQLAVWGKKLHAPVMRGSYGADPSSVVFDALRYFKAHAYDYMLVDTAGRIHTNTNLMNELEKVRRVIGGEIEGAPQEVLLALDASVGQNALRQAREFLKFSGITGVFLAKLDGTAKGGVVIGIVDELSLPVKFIGTGEGEDDLLEFSAESFVDALLS